MQYGVHTKNDFGGAYMTRKEIEEILKKMILRFFPIKTVDLGEIINTVETAVVTFRLF